MYLIVAYHFIQEPCGSPFYRKILFPKVDVLPSQSAYLADSETRIVGYLYRQIRRDIFLGYQNVQEFYRTYHKSYNIYAEYQFKNPRMLI